MVTTRERALEAAVQLLGTEGLRALTHMRVDTRAGLPRGSTSNSFRTRAALLDGVIAWLAEQELGGFDPGFDPSAATADEFAAVYCAMIDALTGPHRIRTVARYVLFLESAGSPRLQAPLVANRRRFEQWMEATLAAMGAPDPIAAARAVMACGEGLILHRITVDPDVAVEGPVRAVVRGVLS